MSALSFEDTISAFKAPPGTKLHILNLGVLSVDEAWYVPKVLVWVGNLLDTVFPSCPSVRIHPASSS